MADQLEPRAEDLHALAMAIRYDLTAAQSKLTELIRQVALVAPSVVTRCDLCGYRPATNLPSLAEHMHHAHGLELADLCAECGLGGGNHAADCAARPSASRAYGVHDGGAGRLDFVEPDRPPSWDPPGP